MYRDDLIAARTHLVFLERQVRAERSARTTLMRYRNALVDELQRLQHAVIWYANGERYGFNELAARDDLSPARRDDPPRRDALEAEIFALPPETVSARMGDLLRQLARRDPRLDELRSQVLELETGNAALRTQVDAFARVHPDHPPPPEFRGTLWHVLVPVGVAVAALVAAGFFTLARP